MGFLEESSENVDESFDRDWEVTSNAGTVRVALVGLGDFSLNRTLLAIQSCDHVDPTVLISGSIEKAEWIANDRDVDTAITYDMFEDGVATDLYDAVYIATPIATHERVTKNAASLGRPCCARSQWQQVPNRRNGWQERVRATV